MKRRWETAHTHALLLGYDAAQVADAVRIVSGGLHLPIPTPSRFWSIEALAIKVSEYLEEQEERRAYLALPRHNGYTETEWQEIMETLRECNRKSIARQLREMEEFAWFFSAQEARDIMQGQAETIQEQQRVIDALWEYICNMPAPNESKG